jgi:dienelactone hydrolase
MVSPGLTETLRVLQPWAERFASWGYVAVFVETISTSELSSQVRSLEMWAAIETMKAENTRSASPLAGKISSCFVASGHSLGGGASLLTANAHPADLKAVIGFNPHEGGTNFSKITGATLILTGQSDTTAAPQSHGRRQYNTLSASIAKQYAETANGSHQSALSPNGLNSQYGISWIKFNVDGDARYKPLLDKAATGLSDFQQSIP